METIIKCGYLFIIAFLIAWAATAENVTTENLLPNGTGSSSSYQNVDNTIPSISTNGFNVVGTVRDWGGELETTGTGSINYTGNLTDYATQQQLDNGITLDSTTVVQNCEWTGSAYQCGQHRAGQDSYTTTVKILDDEGNTLAIVNQTRNNDAGYGNNAFKYEDSVSYTGTGSNQFYWEWEGVDGGSSVNLGGPNLLGAKLTMTYDPTVIPQQTIEEIEDVIEEFVEWQELFEEPVFIEEFIPMPIALEELGIVPLEEEIVFEEIQTLEEEFEEVEILQVFGGPEIVEEEPEPTEETPTETTAATEEFMEEQPEQTESTSVATVQEEPQGEQPEANSMAIVDVQDVQAQVAVKVKGIDKQLAATNIIVAESMEKQQVDISSYYKQYTDNRAIYEGNTYEDLRTLDEYAKKIYTDNKKFMAISMNDPVKDYQNKLRNATIKRQIAEQELRKIRGY